MGIEKEFHKNPKIVENFKRAKDDNGRLHLWAQVRGDTKLHAICVQ